MPLTVDQKTVVEFVADSLIGVSLYIATLAPEEIPRWVAVITFGAAVVARVAKAKFGTAVAAEEVKPA